MIGVSLLGTRNRFGYNAAKCHLFKAGFHFYAAFEVISHPARKPTGTPESSPRGCSLLLTWWTSLPPRHHQQLSEKPPERPPRATGHRRTAAASVAGEWKPPDQSVQYLCPVHTIHLAHFLCQAPRHGARPPHCANPRSPLS